MKAVVLTVIVADEQAEHVEDVLRQAADAENFEASIYALIETREAKQYEETEHREFGSVYDPA